MKTILASTNGSAHADQAVSLAADLASRYSARLHFFHVPLKGGIPDHLEQLSDKQTDVMGCRGLSAMPELTAGSVTHKVQRVFPGTVITVR